MNDGLFVHIRGMLIFNDVPTKGKLPSKHFFVFKVEFTSLQYGGMHTANKMVSLKQSDPFLVLPVV